MLVLNIPFEVLPDYDRIPLSILNLVTQSAFIPNTKLISCALVTKAGLGKTSYLLVLQKLKCVYYVNDITPKYLRQFLQDVDNGKYKFLVIPDYINILGHSKHTKHMAETIFRGMMQEGITEISDYGLEFKCRDINHPPKAGLITAMTTGHANENSGQWRKDGFLSRLLIVSYSHTKTTESRILDSMFKNVFALDAVNLPIIEKPNDVEIGELENKDILLISNDIVEPVEAPYRSYDLVRALCKSSAVLRDSIKVEPVDIEFIRKLSQYINRKEHPL